MKICVIGTGYVGLVAGTCLAEMGNDVICVDKDEKKLKDLEKGIIPIYEPGLEELILSNCSKKRLSFTSNLDTAVKNSKVCFIAVGTPQREDGSADLSSVLGLAEKIAKAMNEYKIIVNKSTVPVGTGEKISEIIKKNSNHEFNIASNPEFLKQGAAVEDFLSPDRIIIGVDSKKAEEIMKEIYTPFVKNGNPILFMDIKSAEMVKYASNSFLATKISFINEIANVCEKVGADIDLVKSGMCADTRIGSKFFFPGLGFGGSCFPKDIQAIVKTAQDFGINCKILKAVNERNLEQREEFIKKVLSIFGDDLSNRTFAIWGLSFKPNTNDMREAPSITIINKLCSLGATVVAFDPKAIHGAKEIFGDKIKYAKNAYDCLKNADALLLLTEWNEFKHPDFDKIKGLLKTPIIIDGRNQYDKKSLKAKGFNYICIGK